MSVRAFWAVSSLVGTFLVCTATGVAATPATPYDFLRFGAIDPQTNGRFGDRMKDAGDVNGDGVGDVWIGVYDRDIGNLPNVGRVYALSGRDRSIIYQIDSPEPQGCSGVGFCGFGWSVSNLGDVDGDRVNDLVVGSVRHNATAAGEACAPPAAGCNAQQGKAWVFSGAPGKQDRPLYELNNPRPQAFGAFGWASTAGDVLGANGLPGKDGISEVLVGAFQNDFPAGCGNQTAVIAPCRKDQGQAFIFNGAPGLTAAQRLAQVRTLDVPPEDRYVDANGVCTSPVAGPTGQRCGALGIVAEGVGDVNNDGFWDQSVTAWTTGIPKPPAVDGPPCLGVHPSNPDDVCNERQGRIYIYSGANGNLLRKVDNPQPQQDALLGLQIVEAGAPGDVDGDGHDDIYANGFTQHGPSFPGNREAHTEGQSWVLSGRTGAVLYRLNDPTPERGGQFGYSLAKTDFNGDGRPDLYVGSSPHHEPGTQQSGGTYVFNGPNGALLKTFDLPASDRQPGTSAADTGPQLGRSVAAPGDVNGDREEDYIAGAPTINTAARVNEGRLYFFLSRASRPGATPTPTPTPASPPLTAAFAGCPALTANVIRGTAAGGRITGTVRGDRIFGGTGNDVVDALAGDDCVDLGTGDDRGQGGLGNDLMSAGLGNDRVSGSSGNDRMRGNSGTDRLNGGRGNDRVFGDAGNDTLLGSFGNDLLHGVSGKDRISGSRGRDRINGGSSNDVISAGSSNDRVAGDQGNDRINGNSGEDVLKGNSGDDRIIGSTGFDRIAGGSGSDRINSRDGRRDRVNCGRGRDRVLADPSDVLARNCEDVSRRG